MKQFLIISIILFIIACKKNPVFILSQACINNSLKKPSRKFLNDFETACSTDSLLFKNLGEWKKFLNQCVTADSAFSANIPAGKYSTRIEFKVSPKGKAINLKIIYDPGYGLAKKALEIFMSYKGKWPVIFEEEPNKTYVQPINFEIDEE